MTRAFGVLLGVIVIAGVAFFLGSRQSSGPLSDGFSTSTLSTTSTDVVATSSGPVVLEVVSEESVYFERVRGFYAEPKTQGNYPGVLMIHEWWGLNDHIRSSALSLAKEGYRVLAVDLFGKVASTSSEARAQVEALNQSRALENLKAGLAFLRGKGSERLASLGFCFGGGQSLQLALSGEKLDSTIIYYGNLVTDKTKLQMISWPVLGIFGDQDRSISTSSVRAFQDALTFVSVPHEVHLYPGVGHAFANPSNQNHAPRETQDAWSKTLSFLARNLKGDNDLFMTTSSPSFVTTSTSDAATSSLKEFSMNSYYEVVNGKPMQKFSLKDMVVARGDTVRIMITNTKGMHDFVIDEYKIKTETPLNKETLIEFKADKAGEFVYYCSKPGHRVNGQWGTLKVVE